MKKIRVLYIHHAATVGGSSNSLRIMISNLPLDAVEAIVLCPPGSAFEAFSKTGIRVIKYAGVSKYSFGLNVKQILVSLRELWYLQSARIIRKTIENIQPDLVHLNELTLIHAAAVVKSMNIPVIMHARIVADRTNWISHKIATAFINRYVDEMIAIDESVKYALREVKSCRVIYNPLRENYNVIDVANTKNEGKKIRVTFLAILLKQKGVWELLQSAKMLKLREDIVFQVAGGNSRSREFHESIFGKTCHLLGVSMDVEKRMKEYVETENLDNVIMIGNVENIDELLRNTDILVFPSHMNGVGRSVFEAGIYGIPAIVAMKDKKEDIVVDGETGIIIQEKDPEAIKKAILVLTDNATLRLRMGMNAREKYLEQFDAKKAAQSVLSVYRKWV